MRVIVTGAAGFIGSNVSRALLLKGHEVVGIDNFNDFYDPRLKESNVLDLEKNPRFELIRATLLEQSTRDQAFRNDIDAVIHLAAWAGVRPSIEKPLVYQEENVGGTAKMLESAKLHGERIGRMPKFVFASSSSVYGCNEKVPFHEEDVVDFPISPYAATKKSCELIAHTYHHLYQMPMTGLRFFTVYGPGQRPDLAINKFTRLLLNDQEIPQFGDGSSSRDYTYIDDIVSGVLAAVERCSTYRIYNLGNSDTVTLSELIQYLSDIVGVPARIRVLPNQPGDVPRTFADISRAKAELGYAPQFKIKKGLEEFVKWYKEFHNYS